MKLVRTEYNDILYYPRLYNTVDRGLESYTMWSLVPIAIYDYVDPDYSDVQGWLQEIPGTGEISYQELTQSICIESLEDVLVDEGFEFVDITDDIYVRNNDERATRISIKDAVDQALDLW